MKKKLLVVPAVLAVLIVVALSIPRKSISQDEELSPEDAIMTPSFGKPKYAMWPNAVNVCSSAWFIELDKKDMDDVEKKIGFSLDPVNGKFYLNAREREILMNALEVAPSVEYLGAASIVTISGQQAQAQLVEEVLYPTEFVVTKPKSGETSGNDGQTHPIPHAFETREIGVLYTITPTLSSDGKIITLVAFPEVSFFHGWVQFGTLVSQPIFTSLNTSTTLHLEDGATVVIKCMPSKAFKQSHVLDPKLKAAKLTPKVNLIICSVKIMEIEDAFGK